MNNKTKVSYDKKTGRARIDIPAHELHDLLIAVQLYQYDELKKTDHIGFELSNEKDDDGELTENAENINYHLGLLAFAKGIQEQVSELRHPMKKDPLKENRTVEQRRKVVVEEIKERKFMDEIFEEALAMKVDV